MTWTFPTSFADLVVLMTTNVMALGAFTSWLLDRLWDLLASTSYCPNTHERAFISLLGPTMISTVFYLAGVAVGYATLGIEPYYQVVIIAGQATVGSQLAYRAYLWWKHDGNDETRIGSDHGGVPC